MKKPQKVDFPKCIEIAVKIVEIEYHISCLGLPNHKKIIKHKKICMNGQMEIA